MTTHLRVCSRMSARPAAMSGLLVLALALACGTASQAQAQAAPATASRTPSAVQVQLSQFKVSRTSEGAVTFVDAAAVRPGDVVEYRAVYRNRSEGAVDGLVATMPIPLGMSYVAQSARSAGPAVEAAADDGVFAPEPLMRNVVQPDGTSRMVPVPLGEYRTLRWKLGSVPAGAVRQVQARAQVTPLVGDASGVKP
jgi:uncharacterized repeat protein (TIGR01451 family)